MDTNLKIALWNARGLVNHGPEIATFIRLHDTDVMLISEAHYTERSYFRIQGYTIYNTKHPSGGGHAGSAIIIKNNIKHYEAPEYRTIHIQATTVCVKDKYGSLLISAIYCPPGPKIKEDDFTQFFATLGNRFLAGGDYNAKHKRWGARYDLTRGRELVKSLDKNNFKVLSTCRPTHWPDDATKMPDVIDFCVLKSIPLDHLSIEESLDLSSDHTPLLVQISTNIIQKQKPASLTTKKTNWELFRNLLDDKLSTNISLKSEEEINEAVENLTKAIQQAAWESTPELNMTTNTKDCSSKVKEALHEKRKLRKTWMTTKAPQDKARFNKAVRDLKELLLKEKNQAIQNYLEGLTPTEATEYSLWKATAKLKKNQEHIPPIRMSNGTWARTDKQKADVFAERLVEVFQPFPSEIPQAEEEVITSVLEQPHQMALPIKAIKLSEVKSMISRNLDPKKAPGYDLITGAVIKQLPEKAIMLITHIFNSILRTGNFPSQWKVAQVILILKPGKPAEEASSYRPISLLPMLSKLFEKLFLKRLKPQLEGLNIIPEHQFGFREQHATIEQVHRVVEQINNTFESKKYCSAAFLDITQAFDKVWHIGLLNKLKTQLPAPFYQVLKSYLNNRFFMVKQQDEITELYPIKSGVPQGSVIGPILYTIYTADIPVTPNTFTATFADDTAILATSEIPKFASEKLQDALNNIQKWLRTWRIKANETKSQHVTFALRRETCPSVTLNGQQLPQSSSAKYLGMHLDRRLNWKEHISKKRKQLGLKFSKLYWLIGRNSKLSLNNKLAVYKVILKPVWTYGVQLWSTASATNINKLQQFQSKILRTITDAPWFVSNETIHHDLNIPYVLQDAKCMSARYLSRLERHPNTLAVNLLDNSRVTYRLKRYTPLDITNRQ